MIARELAAAGIAFLAWLLAVSALHKLRSPARGIEVMRTLLGISGAAAGHMMAAAAGAEAVTALLACVPALQWLAAMLAAGIYAAYALLLARAVAQGHRDLDCGCTLSVAKNVLGAAQIAKAAALCALAGACGAVLLLLGAAPSCSAVLAGLAGLALYVAAEQLDGLAPLRAGEHS